MPGPQPRPQMYSPANESPGIENNSPAAFVDGLIDKALAHEATQHGCLARFGAGGYQQRSLEFARSYGRWYHGYSAWFPHYLRAVIGRLESQEHRTLLASNLAEEQGHLGEDDMEALEELGIDPSTVEGVSHPELFLRYCTALGLTEADLAIPPIPTIEWRSAFKALLRAGSGAYAVGALGLGTEAIVSTIYQPIVRGLKRVPELRREDIVFFELHCLVDDQHYEDLRTISIALASTPEGRTDLERGMLDALDLRLEFWNAFQASQAVNPFVSDETQEARGA